MDIQKTSKQGFIGDKYQQGWSPGIQRMGE